MIGENVKQHQIVFAILIFAFVSVAIWWRRRQPVRFNRASGQAAPNKRADGSEVALRRKLTPHEQRLENLANNMVREGLPVPAAQMLEQAGLFREAVTLLENAKLIDEAATILLRMQKPSRAAALYKRHQMWAGAARCFVLAAAPKSAAECLILAEQHDKAAEIYCKESMFEDAAACFEKSNRLEDAATSWMRVNQPQRSLRCWDYLAKDPRFLDRFRPSDPILDFLYEALKTGSLDGPMLIPLARSSKGTALILELLTNERGDLALKLFQSARPEMASLLMRDVNVQSPAGRQLAILYTQVKEYRMAGILFEQAGQLADAEAAFRLAGDEVRATYCRERATDGHSRAMDPAISDLAERTSTPVKGLPNIGSMDASSQWPLPGAGFVILAGSQTDQNTVPANLLPVPLPSPAGQSPGQSVTSTATEDFNIVQTSWLFHGASAQEITQFCSIARAQEYQSGERLLCGTDLVFLVLPISGSLTSICGSSVNGEWLAPELSLSLGRSCEWAVQSPTKALVVSKVDMDHFFKQNSDFMRIVYINLTQAILKRQG
jgi:tetratricopeptide (TPR) repeat protein